MKFEESDMEMDVNNKRVLFRIVIGGHTYLWMEAVPKKLTAKQLSELKAIALSVFERTRKTIESRG